MGRRKRKTVKKYEPPEKWYRRRGELKEIEEVTETEPRGCGCLSVVVLSVVASVLFGLWRLI